MQIEHQHQQTLCVFFPFVSYPAVQFGQNQKQLPPALLLHPIPLLVSQILEEVRRRRRGRRSPVEDASASAPAVDGNIGSGGGGMGQKKEATQSTTSARSMSHPESEEV